MSGIKKTVIGMIAVLLVLTAGAYGYGVYYFTGHFLPGSMVNGFNCSYMTREEAETLLSEEIGAYVLAIHTRNNGIESISAGQAGLEYASDGSISRLLKKQRRYLWFLSFQQHQDYEIPSSIQYDAEKTEAAIASLNGMQNMEEPTDAYIQETEEGFQIVAETQGCALDPEKTREEIIQALLACQTSLDLEETGCYRTPQIYADDEMLVRNCQQMNQLTDVVITYDFGDRTETVDRSVIKTWLTKDSQGDYILDEEQLAAYIRTLAETYDTIGNTRTFSTYDGREKVLEGGDYGWKIDQEAEAQGLAEAIESGTTQVREPVYSHEGLCRDTNDIGYTYIEIDLTSQRMVFYKDGVPVGDTPVVTGNPNVPGAETPVGCYALGEKQSPATVSGEEYPAAVAYWLPFGDRTGINDASWRSAFGGDIYDFEGTNGCVCAPYDQVKLIYDTAEINTPVVVYK